MCAGKEKKNEIGILIRIDHIRPAEGADCRIFGSTSVSDGSSSSSRCRTIEFG